MANIKKKQSGKSIEIDTSNFTPVQVRLVKSFNATLNQVLHPENEEEYFEASSALLRIAANLIKNSQFKEVSHICNIEQALEYGVDQLADQIYNQEVNIYDN